jgi:hypothetical protein
MGCYVTGKLNAENCHEGGGRMEELKQGRRDCSFSGMLIYEGREYHDKMFGVIFLSRCKDSIHISLKKAEH